MKALLASLFLFLSMCSMYAQHPYNGNGDSSGYDDGDGSKMEKGPHKGPMFTKQDIKLEMVTPSGDKGNDVTFYVYDSLKRTVDATLGSGTVKYVFGNSAEYLETSLRPGTGNKYTARLEGWQEYRTAIVTLKSAGKTYTFSFPKPNNGFQSGQGQDGSHSQEGQIHKSRQGLGPGMGGGSSGY